jgi:hypothetical protein
MKVRATVPAGAAGASPAAPITTAAPAMGIYAGYIGAQVNGYGYAMDVQSGFAVPNWPLISWPYSATDPAQQFYWFTYAGSDEIHPYGTPVKIAEYAPDGHLTNLVVADIGGGVIELRVANGSTFQRWDWNGFGWINEATGRMLKANGGGAFLTGVTPSSTPTPAASYTFHTIGG